MTCSSYFLALSRTLVGPVVHSWPSRTTFQEPLNGQKVSINDLIFNVYCHFHVAFSPPKTIFPQIEFARKKSKIKNQHRFRALTFLFPILRKKSCQSGFSVANFSTLFKIWFFSSPLPSFGKKIKDPDFLIGTDFEKSPQGTNHLGLF